jgi:tRNA-specific 2-thiouridylase
MLRLHVGATAAEGPILDRAGAVLGRHRGIHLYTIGQRSGLGAGSAGRRWVKAIRAADAAVVVTDDERELQRSRITASAMSWVEPPSGAGPARCEVQVRHRAAPVPARAEIADGGEALISCERPVRAPAPGQAAVLYEADRVLGRGWIGTAG